MNAPDTQVLRLRLGQALIGIFLKSASYQAVEILGLAGLDYLVVDAEHAPFAAGDIDRIALAGQSVGLPVLVRVPRLEAGFINTCLDLGAQGIMVPHVRGPEDAARAVAAARYAGGRGFSPSSRSARYGQLGARRHRAETDRRTTIWAQIEDAEALDQLDSIAAVDGIDCLFVGRADLALSLGIEDHADPKLAAAVAQIGAAARRAGCSAGIFINDLAEVPGRLSEGYTCFVCGSDQSLLMQQGLQLRTEFDAFTTS